MKEKIPFINQFTAQIKWLGMYGCENMGQALLSQIFRNKLDRPTKITVVGRDMYKMGEVEKNYQIQVTDNPDDLKNCEVLILAFTPQDLENIPSFYSSKKIVVSLVPGITINEIKKKFSYAKYVRAMPNIGIFEGKGMTGLYFDDDMTAKEKNNILTLFQNGGETLVVKKESDLDKLGTISGVGPALFFHFTEILEKAARKMGFDADDSQLLAQQTFIGAAAVVDGKDDYTVTNWKAKVVSKGGIAEEAVKILEKSKLEDTVIKATKAAYDKSKQLGKTKKTSKKKK